jgi:hypothetical protein
MKKTVILILAVLAFSWTPVVSAEQSPESVVTCLDGGGRSAARRVALHKHLREARVWATYL